MNKQKLIIFCILMFLLFAGACTSDKPGKNQEMVYVEGGEFAMGDIFNEGKEDEKPVHNVKVSSFFICKYEITFDEYDAFCEDTNRKKLDDNDWGRGNMPVIKVSWFEAVAYCNWRSKKEGLSLCYTIDDTDVKCDFSVNGYRLPTEAEWEYAARERGKNVRFGNGKDIAKPKEMNINPNGTYINKVSGVFRGRTVHVGSFAPNSLGIYDMSGNVCEWCWDWFGNYTDLPQINPTGPEIGPHKMLRGGGWDYYAWDARVTNRIRWEPYLWNYRFLGFRLVTSAQ